MNDSQTHLHSENFDLCRICLLEPESNRDIKFFHIFSPNNDGLVLSVTIMEFLGLIIDKNDVKPKIICQNCHKSILGWVEMKKRAAESQIVINYIEKKRYAAVPRISSISGSSALPEAYQSSSNLTDISTHSRNTIESSNSYYSFTRSKSSILNNSKTKLSIQNNFCSSSSSSTNQVSFNQSTSINQSTILPIDDQTSESDDETSCQVVNVASEVICISDSESADESIQNSCKSEYIHNDEITKLNYCSICKKKRKFNHDCSQYNKEFSTCLMPNCNILSRSTRDFTPHYRQHIGIPTGVVLCRRCYKENKKCERDENGRHTNCNTANLFKCYTCNVNYNNMAEFAFHKLKTHNGRLINSSGNYLCFYCEKSSPDLMKINEHIKHCRENQTETVSECNMEQKETEKKILIGKNYVKNVIVPNQEKEKTIPRSSTHFLFTCLKPYCNLIFQNFAVFKFHHREHFAIGNDLMCWQCCSPFSNLNSLRAHQVKGNCRTPGMFECFECFEKYNDLQSLSIHKFIAHNGELISNKKNKKTIKCAYCKIEISIQNLKIHLIKCQSKKEKQFISKPNLITKVNKCGPFKCEFCGKVCLTAAALSSHIKTHSNLPRKRMRRKSNYCMKRKFRKLTNSGEIELHTHNTLINASQSNGTLESDYCSVSETNHIIEIDEKVNILPSTSKSNETIKIDDYNIASSSFIEVTDEKFNILPSTSKNNETIKFDSCSTANTNIKETAEEVNTLHSTSKSNETINIDDCNIAGSSVIEVTDEKFNILPSTFTNNETIKFDGCSTANTNIKETAEEVNTLHSTSKSNETIKIDDCNIASSSVIEVTDEKFNILPSTFTNNETIKFDGCSTANTNIKETADEVNTLHCTSKSNETIKFDGCSTANTNIKETADEVNTLHCTSISNETIKIDDCNIAGSSVIEVTDEKFSILPSTFTNNETIKFDGCSTANTNIKETAEEVNTLHSTSKSNETIKIDDCNIASSSVIEVTDEKFNTLHSTSKNNETIKFDDCSTANTNIKETADEVNTLHCTSISNETIKIDVCNIAGSSVIEVTDEKFNILPSTFTNNETIKFDGCSTANTNIKETAEEVNTLHSTSKSNETIKIDDCNIASSSVIEVTDEKFNILPSTFTNNETIKFDGSSTANTNIKEMAEEVNTLHSTSKSNDTIKFDGCNTTNTNMKETTEEVNTLHSTSKSNDTIKFDGCNTTNTNMKETTEEVNTLHSTSKINGSIKSDDSILDIADKKNEIYEEMCTTLPSTSQSGGSIKSEFTLSNTNNIEENSKEINLKSRTLVINEPDNLFNHDKFTCVNELFPCSKCPKKFSSRRGLSLHHTFHLGVNKIPRNLVKNYYCTKCKEYFTRSGFGDHWKLSHGKRLQYHKSKRYSCSRCLCKFMYKMALAMHKEHKHSDITTNETPFGSSITLPVKTSTTITKDKTHLNNPILLSELHKSYALTSEKSEDPIKTDQKNLNEKTNTLVKVERVELANVIKQNNEVNGYKKNEKQDFRNEKYNAHENIIQSANLIEKTDEVAVEQFKVQNVIVTLNEIINNVDNKKQSSNLSIMEKKKKKKVTTVNKNENNINSVVEENQNRIDKITVKKENQNITEVSNINKTINVKQEFHMSIEKPHE